MTRLILRRSDYVHDLMMVARNELGEREPDSIHEQSTVGATLLNELE